MFKSIAAIAVLSLCLSGCASSNGYYADQGGGGGSYGYSDPEFCKGSNVCPLIIGGALVGLAAVLANHK